MCVSVCVWMCVSVCLRDAWGPAAQGLPGRGLRPVPRQRSPPPRRSGVGHSLPPQPGAESVARAGAMKQARCLPKEVTGPARPARFPGGRGARRSCCFLLPPRGEVRLRPDALSRSRPRPRAGKWVSGSLKALQLPSAPSAASSDHLCFDLPEPAAPPSWSYPGALGPLCFVIWIS